MPIFMEKCVRNRRLSTETAVFVDKPAQAWQSLHRNDGFYGQTGSAWQSLHQNGGFHGEVLLCDEAVENLSGLAGGSVRGGVETGEAGGADGEFAEALVC